MFLNQLQNFNLTCEGFLRIIEIGKEVFADGICIVVDVRDIATAHIMAFEKPEANGRYCVVRNVVRSLEMIMILDKLYPDLGYSISLRQMSIEGNVVCVTGASGYIASWLVKLLLDRGYTVHATIMSLDDPKQTQHLLALDGAKERLSLFEANLTAEGSFDCAVNGCVCVFHTASPVTFAPVDDPQMELLDPAVKGTLNVLKSAAKVQSLKRVVLTSSLAAVLFCDKVRSGVVDETWFSDPVICVQRKLWYQLSKTLAENAAVNFSKENGLDLVVINPGFVIGPLLQPTLNFTSEAFMRFIETGKEVYVDGIYMLVDVRDVATAHVLAFEKPEANGRYCIVADVVWSSDIKMILNKLYPDLGYSIGYKDKCAETQLYSVSKAKAESLGVEFTPLEVSVKDTVESLKEKKFMII